jgi:hypothetical protein
MAQQTSQEFQNNTTPQTSQYVALLFAQANYHRENANWLKLELIADMMAKNEAEYLLFLDADVVLCVSRISLHNLDLGRVWFGRSASSPGCL